MDRICKVIIIILSFFRLRVLDEDVREWSFFWDLLYCIVGVIDFSDEGVKDIRFVIFVVYNVYLLFI